MPGTTSITEELLAQTDGRADFELIDALAFPLPVTVIAEMLGVPAADRPLFRQWSNELHRMTDVDLATEAARDEAVQLMGRFQNYPRDRVRDRRKHPRNDLLSGLVTAGLDGQRLRDEEIVGFATILLIAGHVTTTSALANAMLCFDEHPDAQRALRADSNKIASRHTGCIA